MVKSVGVGVVGSVYWWFIWYWCCCWCGEWSGVEFVFVDVWLDEFVVIE